MSQKDQEKFSLDRKGGTNKSPRLPERKPRFIVWIYLAIFAALMVHLLFFVNNIEPNEVEYSAFLDYVSKGYVEEVTIINDETVDGKYTSEAIREGRVEVKPPQENLLTGPDPSTVGRFTSEMPADHDLVQYLVDYNTAARADGEQEIVFKAERREDWLGGVLIWLIPLAFILAMWIFLMRRMNPGSQVLNIGKNKAILFDALGDLKLTFKDVAGLEEAKEEVEEIVQFLKNPGKFTRLGGKLPKGVLLVGPPGTGKTLLAKAVAGEADVPFFSLSGSDFVEMFVGVGASRVRDLFEQAKEDAPAIIFIDEIDAVGRHRGAGLGGGHDEREQTLNQLLVEMDGFDVATGVILIAATNRPDILDPALLRPGRFDRQIVVDRPDLRGRKAIADVHVAGKPLGPDVSTEVIARRTPGFTGADIANLLNEAALITVRRDKTTIGQDEIEAAIDRVIAGPERRSRAMSDKEKAVIAYHEAGHALVGHALSNTDPIHKISIIARGRALGWTLALPEQDKYLQTRAELTDSMAMLLGGRTAEEIVFGEITTGASDDIDRVATIARAMVTEYGMSNTLGPQRLGRKSGEVFLGKDQGHEADYSDHVAAQIDAEVHALVDAAHEEARSILTTHRHVLNELAETLIQHETLEGDALDNILAGVGVSLSDSLDGDYYGRVDTQSPQSGGLQAPQPAPHMRAEGTDTP